MNVLSLFDGISCGQVALQRAGIKVDNYFASEIDKYAIQVTMKNFPDTIQLGSILDIKAEDLPQIDLFIGGSPCSGFSVAGKGLNFEDPQSKLFFEYVRLLKECKPKYFLLENVKMKKEWQNIISEYMGVQSIEINSSLVSAQNRKRLYWTNIPFMGQPEDRGILLRDILENAEPNETVAGRMVGRRIGEDGKRKDYDTSIETKQRIEINSNPQKTNTLTTVEKDNILLEIESDIVPESFDVSENKSLKILKYDGETGLSPRNFNGKAYVGSEKSVALTLPSGNNATLVVRKNGRVRKLTPIECERLQTLPDHYTESISNSQRYKCIGNGWTVDVIAHILKGILDEIKISEQEIVSGEIPEGYALTKIIP
jgi:DNA-cytosine methyltransferase